MAELNYEILLSATRDASVGSIFKSMGGQIGELGQAVRNLDRVMRAAEGVDQLRKRIDELNAEMASGARPADEIQKELDRVSRAMARAEEAARRYGIDLDNLEDQLGEMGRASEDARRRLERLRSAQEMNARGMELLGQAAATAATLMVMQKPISDAIELQSAYTGLNRAMNGTQEQFDAATRSVEETSRATGIAATEMADLYTAAAQSGATADELNQVAVQAARVAVAMDYANPADAAKDFENLKNSLAINRTELADLADGINYLADQGNASVKGIVDLTQRIAGIGKAAGLNGLQIAAFGSYVEGLGEPPERAATSLEHLFRTMTQGSSMSKGAREALAGIGLDSENVAKMMQRDAVGTIGLLLRQLNKLPKEGQLATITEIFGSEGASSISAMAQNVDGLSAELDKVSDRTKYAGSVQGEFDRQSQTTAFQINRMKASLQITSAAIGEAFLPAVSKLAGVVADISGRISNWIHENEGLVKVIGTVVAGFIAAKAAIIGFNGAALLARMSVLQTRMFFETLQKTVAGLGGTFTKLFTAIRAFSIGQLFTPWGLAIAGVVAASYLLWKYWDQFSAFAKGVWKGIQGAIEPLEGSFEPIIRAMKPLADAFASLFGDITTQSKASQTELQKWTEVGATIGNAIGGALNIVMTVLDAIGSYIGWFFGNLVGLFIAPVGTIKNVFSDLGGFIKSVFGDTFSWVGSMIDWLAGKIQGLLNLPSKVGDAVSGLVDRTTGWVGDKASDVGGWVSRQFGGGNDEGKATLQESTTSKLKPAARMPEPVTAANDRSFSGPGPAPQDPAQKNPRDNVIPFPQRPVVVPRGTTTQNQTNNTTVNAPITINVPPGGDPEAVGRAVSEHLRRNQENQQRQQRAQMVD
jgi:TP901 family phage tail tape measure protein